MPDDQPTPDQFASVKELIVASEAFHDAQPPSPSELVQRAARMGDESLRAIALQIRRVQGKEPEDDEWIMRVWMDYQFLIVALWRLRTTASIAAAADPTDTITGAIAAFDARLPHLATMRHVAQHLDDYAVDHPTKRRQKHPVNGGAISRRLLEVEAGGNDTYTWLRGTLDLNEAKAASWDLLRAIRELRSRIASEELSS